MAKDKLKITLDTNLLQEYWKERPKKGIVENLLSLAKLGKIDLAITARVREDIPNKPLSEKIINLEEIPVVEIGSVTRTGVWVLDRDLLGEKDFKDFIREIEHDVIKSIKNPPDWRDFDHIHAHYLHKRDVFLTWDDGILSLKELLKKKFGVIVQKPEEFIEGLNQD